MVDNRKYGSEARIALNKGTKCLGINLNSLQYICVYCVPKDSLHVFFSIKNSAYFVRFKPYLHYAFVML